MHVRLVNTLLAILFWRINCGEGATTHSKIISYQSKWWVGPLQTIVFPLYVNIKQILILHFVIHLADFYFYFLLRKVVEFKIKKIFFFYNIYIYIYIF